jgi:hypothetical protein
VSPSQRLLPRATAAQPVSAHSAEPVRPPLGGVWLLCALLTLAGFALKNPAALFLAQAGWLALLLPLRERCAALPAAAVLLAATYLALSELLWMGSRALGAAPRGEVLDKIPLVVSLLLAAFVVRRAGFNGPLRRLRATQLSSMSLPGLVGCAAVAALVWPALRPGAGLSAVPFAAGGFEHMHNLARAALIGGDHVVPYGDLNPVRNFTGDYYPRGFHLLASWFNAALGLDPNSDTEAWAVGYIRLSWLVWALLAVALFSLGRVLALRLGAAREISLASGLASAAVLFLPYVHYAIVGVGFVAYAVALLAVAATLAVVGAGEKGPWPSLLASAAFVVASHGWLVLAPVAAAIGAATFLFWRAGAPLRRQLALALALGAVALVGARPAIFTLFSGSAQTQAKEPGSIALVPPVLLLMVAAGLMLLTLLCGRDADLLRDTVAPAAALVLASVVGVRAAGWNVGLYYPQKIFWALFVLLAAPAIVGAVVTLQPLLRAVRPAALRGTLVGGAVCAALLLPTTAQPRAVEALVLGRTSAGPTTAELASRALAVAAEKQLVAIGVDGETPDLLASMWGRAGRDIRGLPSLDVSNIPWAEATRERVCSGARDAGVTLMLVARSEDGRLRVSDCG